MTCCEPLEQLERDYDLPFVRPMFLTAASKSLAIGDIAIALRTLTPTGKLSQKGHQTLVMNFCPICGTDLRPEET